MGAACRMTALVFGVYRACGGDAGVAGYGIRRSGVVARSGTFPLRRGGVSRGVASLFVAASLHVRVGGLAFPCVATGPNVLQVDHLLQDPFGGVIITCGGGVVPALSLPLVDAVSGERVACIAASAYVCAAV